MPETVFFKIKFVFLKHLCNLEFDMSNSEGKFMEDRLVTLATHTYEKAQILRSVLEIYGIDVYVQDVNPLLPAMPFSYKVRVKESDLQRALSVIENMKNSEQSSQEDDEKGILLMPVDFSEYTIKLCELGFQMAAVMGLRVIVYHAYTVQKTVMATMEVYETKRDEANLKQMEAQVNEKMNHLRSLIEEEMASNKIPRVEYCSMMHEGIPEEKILDFAEAVKPVAIVMGTRGCSQKDLDLIGSVTAEVMERADVPVFTVPQNTHFMGLSGVRHLACSTNFDDGDLEKYDKLFHYISEGLFSSDVTIHFIHYESKNDVWALIKLKGLKAYFLEKYPMLTIDVHLLNGPDILTAYDEFIKNNNVDVISLTTHRRSLFTRMFNPSMARKIVFHTNTPMIVFHAD